MVLDSHFSFSAWELHSCVKSRKGLVQHLVILQNSKTKILYYGTVDKVTQNKGLSWFTFRLSLKKKKIFFTPQHLSHIGGCTFQARCFRFEQKNISVIKGSGKGFWFMFLLLDFLLLLLKVVDFHWSKTFLLTPRQHWNEGHIFPTSAGVSLSIFNLVSCKWIDPNCCCPLLYLLRLQG